MTLYIIDLFCGAGGFSTGAKYADAKVTVAVDSWQKALDVHKDNHPNTVHLNMNLGGNIKKTTEFILSHVPKLKKNDKVHVHASPPCQQLSNINTQRNENEGLKMVKWTLKFVQQDCFDSYTIEQVNNKHVRDLYTKLKIPFILCDFSKLGVCQSRRRLIASNNLTLLKTLSELDIPFPPFHTIVDKPLVYISCSFNNTEYKKKYNSLEPYYTVIKSFEHYKYYDMKNNMYILDIKVAMKLQGFPQNYFDTCSKTDTRQMIANAVPAQVGYIVTLLLLNEKLDQF
jgi:site-specific DNA-cytosine methylase